MIAVQRLLACFELYTRMRHDAKTDVAGGTWVRCKACRLVVSFAHDTIYVACDNSIKYRLRKRGFDGFLQIT